MPKTQKEIIGQLLFQGSPAIAKSDSFVGTTGAAIDRKNACIEARKGSEAPVGVHIPKVNNLIHFITQVENKVLKYGFQDAGDQRTYIVEGMCENAYKAMVTIEKYDINVTAWVKHEEALSGLYGGIVGVIASDKKIREKLINFTKIFKDELEESKMNKVYDAFYYDIKYQVPELAGSIVLEDESKLNNLLQRVAAFDPLPVPDGIRDIVGGEYFPTFDKTVGTTEAAAIEEDRHDELEEFRAACLRGEYRLFEKYFTEGNDKIPNVSILAGYYFTETFRKVVQLCFNYMKHVFLIGTENERSPYMKYDAKDQDIAPLNYHLYGPPGTGKSYLCTALGAALGVPVYEFTVTGGFEEGNFNKMPEWNDEGNIFMRTQTFREGFVNGGIVCMDEMNLAKPDISMMLSGALERPYVIGQDPNTTRNAATIIFATSNPGTAGTKAQNNALASRFRALKVDCMSNEELLGLVRARRMKKAAQCDTASETKIMEIFAEIHEKFKKLAEDMDEFKTIAEVVSPRSLMGCFEEYCDLGATLEDAILSCIINPARLAVENKGDEEMIEAFDQSILISVATKFKEKNSIFSHTYEENCRKGKSK